jgi:hypothetical protein
MIFQNIGSFSIFFFAFLLGIKHSFDADHLVAVSSFLINSKSRKKTVLLSISWALGHATTAGILTIILFTFRQTVLKDILSNMEFIVAAVLIIIAVFTILYEFDLVKFHKHSHSDVLESAINAPVSMKKKKVIDNENPDHEHTHVHTRIRDKIKRKDIDLTYQHSHEHKEHREKSYGVMILIGVIQGIVSNDELLLLMTLTLEVQLISTLLFGILFFTLGVVAGMILFSLLVSLPIVQYKKKRVIRIINLSVAIISILYAIRILLGFDGINIIDLFL